MRATLFRIRARRESQASQKVNVWRPKFLCCGQATPEERLAANTVADWFRASGYEPYVAVTVQTIMDLNSGIIGALKTSDYYVLINFRREEISGNPVLYRGSLYTHQELAAAYVLDFQDMILVSQRDLKQEGILKFIVSNAQTFDSANEVLGIVQNCVAQANWSPSFSRQLSLTQVRWGPLCITLTTLQEQSTSLQSPAWRYTKQPKRHSRSPRDLSSERDYGRSRLGRHRSIRVKGEWVHWVRAYNLACIGGIIRLV